MDPNNITCVQRVQFIFAFLEKRVWQSGEKPPLNDILRSGVDPGAVRHLGGFVSRRLDRIAEMMEVLLSAHGGWATVGKKDRIIMETKSFDFNDAVKLLNERGFHDDEFVIKVEYERKWGVL
jgi:hypothetical protein